MKAPKVRLLTVLLGELPHPRAPAVISVLITFRRVHHKARRQAREQPNDWPFYCYYFKPLNEEMRVI